MSSLHSWNAGDQLNAADLNGNFNILSPSRYLSLVAAEAISPLDPVRIGTYQSDGGILYDNSVSFSAGSSTSITVGSHSNRLIVLTIVTNSISTTATCGGSAMTQRVQTGSGSIWTYIFTFVAPATGSVTIAWTGTPSGGVIYSLYNCDQTTGVDGSGIGTFGTGATMSVNITPTVEGDMLIGCVGSTGGGIASVNASPNAINQHNILITSAFAAGLSLPIEGTGQQTVNGNQGGSITIATGAILVKPFATYQRAVYRANASDATHANAFIGFAESAIAKDATGVVVIGGKVTGLSLLTTASQYYLGNSSGAANLSTSAGTVSRKVGIALNQTDLLITNEW